MENMYMKLREGRGEKKCKIKCTCSWYITDTFQNSSNLEEKTVRIDEISQPQHVLLKRCTHNASWRHHVSEQFLLKEDMGNEVMKEVTFSKEH